jgi:hypothetical protein
MPRLTIELVPSSCWFSNVRSNVPSSVWEVLKKQTAKLTRYRCEICAGRGRRWPVECHEVWLYDDKTHTQTLVRLIALCPMCHKVKHIGLASVNGEFDEVRAHLMKVNQWPQQATADAYIARAFHIFEERSQHEWALDISYLKQFGIDPAAFSRPVDVTVRILPVMIPSGVIPKSIAPYVSAADFDPFDHIICEERVA